MDIKNFIIRVNLSHLRQQRTFIRRPRYRYTF